MSSMKLWGAVLVAVVLSACAVAPKYTPDQMKFIGAVTDEVVITDIKQTAALDGTIQVAVFVTSAVRYRQQLEYRVNWFDANGMPIKTTVSAPVTRTVDGGQSFNFSATGPGAHAVHYTIDVRAEGE